MWQVRSIRDDEVDLFRARLARAFGGDGSSDEEAVARFRALFDLERTVAAFDGDDMVGTGAAFSFDVTVPGGESVPMAGTTVVSVQPTHRRRGVLRAMMAHHLDDVAARGEPLAGLWASESGIYGRFGYGLATERHEITMQAPSITMRRPLPAGSVRFVEHDDAEGVLRRVYESVRPSVPGMLSRSDAWWTHRRMRDDDEVRDGKSARRYAVYEGDDGVEGYVTYRQKENWTDFVAAGEVDVIELLTTSHDAHTALWHFLTNIDLFPKVTWWNAPVDDPLPFEVTDPRRVERRRSDAMWLRLVDVAAALEARSYDRDGEMVIEVVDDLRPGSAGAYRLVVEEGKATCGEVDDQPRVTVDVDALGSLYLGGGDAFALAASGRLTGDAGTVRDLHRLFRTDRAPWCEEVF